MSHETYTDGINLCPDCGSKLRHEGASDALGVQSVSYRLCTGCKGFENTHGEWVSEGEVLEKLRSVRANLYRQEADR